jgi:hypothetical protein
MLERSGVRGRRVVELGEERVLAAVVAAEGDIEVVVEVNDREDEGRKAGNLELDACRGEGVDTEIKRRFAWRGVERFRKAACASLRRHKGPQRAELMREVEEEQSRQIEGG